MRKFRRLRPKKLRELRSRMGALNQMNKFIPKLARLCARLQPLFCKTNEWKWTDEHEKTFQRIKKEIQTITEINISKETNLQKQCVTQAEMAWG